jgi:hypothetical protein
VAHCSPESVAHLPAESVAHFDRNTQLQLGGPDVAENIVPQY